MSATHWGLLLTVLTGFAAGAAATAWDDRQILFAISATLVLQASAIMCFLIGSRRRNRRGRILTDDERKNTLTATQRADTMIAPHTDNNRTGIEI